MCVRGGVLLCVYVVYAYPHSNTHTHTVWGSTSGQDSLTHGAVPSIDFISVHHWPEYVVKFVLHVLTSLLLSCTTHTHLYHLHSSWATWQMPWAVNFLQSQMIVGARLKKPVVLEEVGVLRVPPGYDLAPIHVPTHSLHSPTHSVWQKRRYCRRSGRCEKRVV